MRGGVHRREIHREEARDAGARRERALPREVEGMQRLGVARRKLERRHRAAALNGAARPVVLASASAVRTRLLTSAGVPHEIVPADVDEADIRDRLLADGAPHPQIAEVLAELQETIKMEELEVLHFMQLLFHNLTQRHIQ